MPVERIGFGRTGHQYDLAKVFHWRVARNEAGGETSREKLSRVNSELKELELAKERGLVVDREDVIARWAQCASAFRNRLRAMRRKVTPLITTPENRVKVEEILGRHIDEALLEMTTDDFAKAVVEGPEEGADSPPTTTKLLRKSVGRRQAATQ